MSRPATGRRIDVRRSQIYDGARVPTSIDLSTAIVCTRATEASYQTGAENDGSSAFLAWASANVLRVQNRGSRNAIFVEGARQNYLVRSQELTVSPWTQLGLAPNHATQTAAANAGPDGANLATRVVASAVQFSRKQGPATGTGALFSAWYRATSGTTPVRPNSNFPSGTPSTQTIGTTYTRVLCPRASAVLNTYPIDGTIGGACDAYVDLMQLEVGHFASSAIRTVGSTVTRSADACVIADASIPSWLRSGKWTCTISLECTSAEFIAAATEMTLFAFSTGTNDRISLVLDSGAMKVRVTQGGATKVTTGAITATSRYLDITLTFDAAAGEVTVAGATTGNGTTAATAWTMQSGDVYVGNGSGGTTPYFGEILPTVSQVP